MRKYIVDDKEYWNNFYRNKNTGIYSNTLFSEFIFHNWVGERKNLLECGCGNGRDSLFFGKKGLHVVGIDASKQAIESITNKLPNCRFICGDFIDLDQVCSQTYDICYSRFTLHAISLEQELKFMHNVFNYLNKKGLFCIEVRSIHDELYGKGKNVDKDAFIFNSHYRRFIKMEELLMRLIETGFIIKYAEENVGFAPFGNSDPYIIRIVALKE